MIKTTHMQKLDAFVRYIKKSVWPAYMGCLWAVMYAVFVRFYQAAGGMIGVSGEFYDPEVFHMASYIAGVQIMACGFALIALVKPWGKVVPVWMPLIGGRKIHRLILLIPTLCGSAFLLAHGFSGIITKALHLAGVITMHFPGWKVLDVHRLVLWDLFFYEPWFIIMGILSALAALHYAQVSGVQSTALRRKTMIFLSIVILLTTLVVFAVIF
ncbi:DUF3995 domain-containing protein [Pseudogracilibacillus auburnensis]|uniref:DUF3995 domain-containing protein n=1 Tax=Pseudogracilibacillus auburnensis TaxID=1494959 RepID=UPI001A97A6E6|nr:DUF3995 domain-containing protein [Pseudogracilibacillus auburnensis]MBO1005101.1 DUF3995 domain-containing protein [Pseudogracilibacillus auburnensis]